MRLMRRSRLAWALLGLAAALAAGAGLAVAAGRPGAGVIAEGVTVGGVPVGGLAPVQARRALARRVQALESRPVTVLIAGRAFTLTGGRAGVRAGADEALARAWAVGRRRSSLERGVRRLAGLQDRADIPLAVRADPAAVRAWARAAAAAVFRPARDGRLSISLARVAAVPGRPGRALASPARLAAAAAAAFADPAGPRRFSWPVRRTAPKVTAAQAEARSPRVITVSKAATAARLFVRPAAGLSYRLARSYRVAVGQPAWPTPEGLFAVQSKQINPVWSVPQSSWAGDKAGQVIPGGSPQNPLKARWIGITGSVGFHGTADRGSIGSAASHGCVRMLVEDVKDLYRRVQAGDPVLIG